MLEPHYIVTSNYEKSKCTIIRNPHIHMPTDIQDTTVEKITGNSLPIKWLGLSTFTAMDPDLMPGWRSNISQATWRGQKAEKKKEQKEKNYRFCSCLQNHTVPTTTCINKIGVCTLSVAFMEPVTELWHNCCGVA